MDNPSTLARPDIDIEEQVAQLVRSYSPLLMSRGYFTYKSVAGVLTLHGNVRTMQARRVLTENAARIAGVVRVDEANLYDDEQLRGAVGQLLPPGVYATVHGGVIALTGKAPAKNAIDALMAAVQAVPGVRRVGVALDDDRKK